MKSFCAQSVAWALGLAWLASPAQAQYPNQYQNSYLPIPAATQSYPVAPVGLRETWQEGKAAPADVLPSPSDAPSILPAPPMAQADQSVLSDDYRKAVNGGWGDKNVVNDSGTCGPECCEPCCCNYWYGSVGVIVMERSQHADFLVARNAAGDEVCVCQFDMDFTSGIETTIGHTFCCGNNALQFTYWGLYPEDNVNTGVASELGLLTSGINFTGATYNGAPASDLTIDSEMQQGIVHQSMANFEVSLLGQSWGNGFIGGNMTSSYGQGYSGPRWGFGWLAGIRYFEFDNGVTLRFDGADEVFSNDVNEFAFQQRLINRMVGFQVGGGFNYSVFNNLQVYALGKAGLYNNSISQTMLLNGAGGVGTFGDGSEININNSISRVAMIGQIDLGARYSFGQHISLTLGYRLMCASGVALTGQNIPSDFTDSFYAAKIEADGALLLTGGYAGVEWRF